VGSSRNTGRGTDWWRSPSDDEDVGEWRVSSSRYPSVDKEKAYRFYYTAVKNEQNVAFGSYIIIHNTFWKL